MATCPQCGSENIQEMIMPPCVSYTCLDCGYEWVTCLDPRLMYLPLKTLICGGVGGAIVGGLTKRQLKWVGIGAVTGGLLGWLCGVTYSAYLASQL